MATALIVKAHYQEQVDNLTSENEQLSKDIEDGIAVYKESSKEVILSEVESEIQEIGELATIEYRYTDAGKYTDAKKLFGHSVPFTTKSFILKWDGVIKAGIQVADISASVDNEQKTITVNLPKAEILSHEIDEDSFETLDENNNVFNPIDVGDVRSFDNATKDEMEKEVIEKGLLDDAYTNAQNVIRQFLNTNSVIEEEYEIVFASA